jgi:hypothetical protein
VSENILDLIDAISKDKSFSPASNLFRIRRIAKGYAPMLSQVLREYIRQNEPNPKYKKARLTAAKKMLGKRYGGFGE